jgi:hypothetical protein
MSFDFLWQLMRSLFQPIKKGLSKKSEALIIHLFICRGDLTRTDDPLHPMQVR